jgi:hypothetical protein
MLLLWSSTPWNMQTLSVSCSFSNTNTHRFHCDLAQPGICKPCQSVVYSETQIRIDSTAVKHTLEYANLVSQSVVHPVCETFFFVFCNLIFFCRFIFFFCWSSKNSWDRSGGVLLFKVVFLLYLFLKINRPRQLFSGGSNIRVLEARGLAGLAGLAGRRMEQRSLARSMLWRDRRIVLFGKPRL